jgi:hypothetical protein
MQTIDNSRTALLTFRLNFNFFKNQKPFIMKPFQRSLKLFFVLLLIQLMSCSKDSLIETESVRNDDDLVTSRTTIDCRDEYNNLAGSWPAGSGYQYVYHIIDVSCVAYGDIVQLSVVAYDVPNRFTVRTGSIPGSGSYVTDSGWIGYANYSGPWGSSLSTQNTQTITFTKTSDYYTIQIETSVPSFMSDSWEVNLACECEPECLDNCGTNFGDTYYGTGFYIYPAIPLTFQCLDQNNCPVQSVQITVTALDVPNRFTIRRGSSTGTIVTQTNWIGYADYYGPWGSSLSTQNTQTLTFNYLSGTTYYFIVETSAPSSPYDAWQASIACSYSCGGPTF